MLGFFPDKIIFSSEWLTIINFIKLYKFTDVMVKKEVILTDKVCFVDCATADYKVAIEAGRVLPTIETIAHAYVMNDDKPEISRRSLNNLTLIIKKSSRFQPTKFSTSNTEDISNLLRDYNIEPVSGFQEILGLKGKEIGVYVYYHQIAAVSPVAEKARVPKS